MNWYERGKRSENRSDRSRSKEGSFLKEGPEYSSRTRYAGSEGSTEGSSRGKASMRMMKIRQRSEFGDLLLQIVKVLSKIVEKEAQLDTFKKTVRESPDLGFQFSKEGDSGDSVFRVDCDFEIANDYMKIIISGYDEEGSSFSGRVNMFMTDTLVKIGRRVSGIIPSHSFG
jgi:hypothetical protein